ncbi:MULTISPECIES: hypothetical protein [Celeribacter]|jgi:hypothetical protein|uniref:Uncharacterized protein n=1 Tax=Celeribacter halophilus TaxID=576117 RepID=A0A1I3SVK3_9RHOB|nr:hypothetical protein [Celeribacter halophilus]MBU2889971.1 hypothetical protein [Celeribacter halophilus]MDO6457813.1 hypothetical protein [Celeribacter halophilus]MDO6511416.1 hypothetical protein [Celeribacter halophilus]MDO6724071.1 hypothetical protein [Celeribacter halophilus]PZX12120.1 hypothetical protein LX82_01664 [Celeribacter halophilus]
MIWLLSIPGMIARILLSMAFWLMLRPGGWLVACCLAVAATWYIKT